MLKNAHISSQPDFKELRDDQFALIVTEKGAEPQRLFPVFTKQAAAQSAQDFCGSYIYLGAEEQKAAAYYIKEALDMHHLIVSPLIQKLASEEVMTNKVANEKVEAPKPVKRIFALPEYRKYPLDTIEDVKAASDYFGKYASKMEREYLQPYAQNVLNRATELKVDVVDEIIKYAHPVYREDLGTQLQLRMSLSPDSKEMITKLASLALNIDPLDFSKALEEVDVRYGMNNQWGRMISKPEDAVLESGGEIRKLAAGKSWSFSANGKSYSENDLQRACSSEMVKKMYGNQMATQISNPSVFDSLPTPVKEQVLSYA